MLLCVAIRRDAHIKGRAMEAEEQLRVNQELMDATVRVADSIIDKSARLHAMEASYHRFICVREAAR